MSRPRLFDPLPGFWLALVLSVTLTGCAIFSEETQSACNAIKPMYDDLIADGPPPTLSDVGAQIDACLAGIERDSKAWNLALKILEQALQDAWDDFRRSLLVGLFKSDADVAAAAARRAELELQLEAYRTP